MNSSPKRLITIDNGNTHPHVGIFLENNLEKVIPLSEYEPLATDVILVSNVGNKINHQPSIDLKKFRLENTFFNMPIHYSMTLGEDRLYTSFFLFLSLKLNERILVLDAGTFLTADLITEKGFMGGYIFPGSKIFLNSYLAGANLPVIEKLSINNDLPHSTEEAISMGHELFFESILENLVKKISPSRIIITGGDGQMLASKIKKINSTFPLEFDPHLVHLSLQGIYVHLLQSNSISR